MYDSRDTSIPQEEPRHFREVVLLCFKKHKIPARLVLYFLSWSGFLVSFMMRNDMNFALIAIYPKDNTNQNTTNTSYSIPESVIFITASYAGAMANIIDLAPNYGHSAAVLAFCQTIHMSASFISPLTAGFIVTQEDSIDQWRSVFGVAAVISLLTYIVYQIFGTAEIQPWNIKLPKIDHSDEETEIFPKSNREFNTISEPM
ncbi:sodium-dependent phosphate transport protein 4 isoform X4 [Drosophila obscura]|uniref:sodium-dependent phosphate transport protein 4 isoform X4 n=1 Tax=Drosophila obscura TaxID=7282 RepID=UPI001BB14E77|nr:sodium-dependent phosphate transport protein 4 isoform X4 [Drosophila obscura]